MDKQTFAIEGKVITIPSINDYPDVIADDFQQLAYILDTLVGKRVSVQITVLEDE